MRSEDSITFIIEKDLDGKVYARMKEFPKYRVYPEGYIRGKYGKILKPNIFNETLYVGLVDRSGVKRNCIIHRLIAEAFLPKDLDEDTIIKFKDENRLNATLDNLYRTTTKKYRPDLEHLSLEEWR